jgi:hypothetical protein
VAKSRLGKRYARVIELVISPLWLVLLFLAWKSGASFKMMAVASGVLAAYYLFFVPRSCGALRSNGKSFCTDDGRGFLIGCGRIDHLKWNLAKYLPGGWSPRRRAPDMPRGSSGETGRPTGAPSDGGLVLTELLAGFEAIVATISLIVTILAWQFPRT